MTFTESEDVSAVSLEDLEAYLARNTRPILQSVVPEQQRVTPPFTAGSTGQPPANVDETGGNGDSANNPAPHMVSPVTDDTTVDDADDEEPTAEELAAAQAELAAEQAAAATTDADPTVLANPDDPFGIKPPETSASSDDSLIEVSPGVHMTRAAISEALAARPPAAPQIPAGGDGSVTGEQTSAPVTPPASQVTQVPASPQEILDDPELAPIVTMLRSQQSTMDQQQQALTYLNDVVVARETEAIQSRVAAGINKFKAAKSLTDEQITSVNQVAARLNIMPTLANGVDPITGEQKARDPEEAAYRALEIAFWQMPEHRAAALDQEVKQRAKDSRRKQRLAGVSGGSGSVQRTTTVPTDRRSRELAAVSDLREMMNPGQGE